LARPRTWIVWGLLLLVGCGRGGGGANLTPVQGRVFYKGEPLAGGTIVFTPDQEHGGRGPQAWAKIDADGRYRLTTDDRHGATPGWHRITVACSASQLPPRYRDPELSGQRFEVRLDRANTCDLHLD
jgi:hypothetical protein